jgi:hypothetical protein
MINALKLAVMMLCVGVITAMALMAIMTNCVEPATDAEIERLLSGETGEVEDK